MTVEKIEWMDEAEKEAIVTVSCNGYKVVCFSHPCLLKTGCKFEELLECIDAKCVTNCECVAKIQKKGGFFGYELQGKIVDREKGIININGLIFHIDADEIPKDVKEEMYISFETSRIDIW